MEVRGVLADFLATRGWAVRFDNLGGGSFALGPRDARLIRPHLVSGQDFSAGDIASGGVVTVRLLLLADGIVVGGLTYVLDPALTVAPKESPCAEHCTKHHRAKGCCCGPCIDERCEQYERCREESRCDCPCHTNGARHPPYHDCEPASADPCRDECPEQKRHSRRIRVEVDLDSPRKKCGALNDKKVSH